MRTSNVRIGNGKNRIVREIIPNDVSAVASNSRVLNTFCRYQRLKMRYPSYIMLP
jgi:hypothetical protein